MFLLVKKQDQPGPLQIVISSTCPNVFAKLIRDHPAIHEKLGTEYEALVTTELSKWLERHHDLDPKMQDLINLLKRDAGCRGSGIPGASALGGAYPTVAMR